MPRLFLLRHAKAEPAAGRRDHARPLSDRGRDDASLIGRYMAAQGWVPELMLASTAARTRETLSIVAMALSLPPVGLFLDGLYEAGPAGYVAAIARHGGAAASLLVIGHNPAIAMTARTLVADDAPFAGAFATGALAVIDFDGPLAEVAAGKGRLAAFVAPGDIGGGA